MDISTKNIERVTAHAELIRWQWADRDAQAEALRAARARYVERMAEHDYVVPPDQSGPVEAVGALLRRLRLFAGFLRSEA